MTHFEGSATERYTFLICFILVEMSVIFVLCFQDEIWIAAICKNELKGEKAEKVRKSFLKAFKNISR